LSPELKFKSVTFRAYVGVEAKAPLFKPYKKEFGMTLKFEKNKPGEIFVIPLDEGKPATWQPDSATFLQWGEGYQLSQAPPLRAVRASDLKTAGGGVEEIVVENVHDLAMPGIVVASPEVTLLFSQYDEGKPWYASTDISMARNPGGGSWTLSDVTDNSQAEFAPTGGNDGGGGSLFSAWMRVVGDVSSAAEPADVFPHMEVVAAKYTRASSSWGTPVPLTSNSQVDRSPQVICYGSQVGVIWIQNEAGESIGDATYGDSLMLSTWNGSAWDTATTLWSSTNKGIINTAFCEDSGGEGHIVFTVDEDGDWLTAADLELYRVSTSGGSWGSATRLTNNSKADDLPVLVAPAGVATVVWASSDELQYSPLAGFSPQAVYAQQGPTTRASELAGATLTNGAAVAYTTESASGVDIVGAFYDVPTGLWSLPRQLTQDPDAESALAMVADGSEVLLSYLKTEMLSVSKDIFIDDATYTIENIPASGQTDICLLRHALGQDLAIQDDSLTFSNANPAPGQTVTISAVVENRGELVETNVPVEFYDGDPGAGGILIDVRKTIAGPLVGGATGAVSVSWTISDSMAEHQVYVIVDPEQVLD